MRQTGIWLDYDHANIFHLQNDQVNEVMVKSNIESYKLKGGARSKTPWGPMDNTSESKHLERNKHQKNAYYKEICEKLKETDELLIMGPAEAKEGLNKYLKKHKGLKNNASLLDIQTVDSITKNQQIEKVKSFFNVIN